MLAFDRIVFPTDFSETARAALPYASFLAARHGATLHLLHVESVPRAPSIKESLPRTDTELDECARQASQQFGVEASELDESQLVRATRSGPSVRDVVADYAEEVEADLIVMGTARRRGLSSLFPQSTAADVIRYAPCPVLTVLDDADVALAPVRTILVPHDFSEHADHALHYAQELAQLYDADILPVHVIEELTVPVVYEVEPTEVDTERVRERTTSALRDATNVRDVRVVSGHAGRRLVEVAEEEDVDLVVLATHGRTGLSRMLLGSVAETVIRRAPCPVFTVKATPTSDEIPPDADDAGR